MTKNCPTHQQCVSVIGLHLMQNPECATHYINDVSSFAIGSCIYQNQ